jgi:hypothetical protein
MAERTEVMGDIHQLILAIDLCLIGLVTYETFILGH